MEILDKQEPGSQVSQGRRKNFSGGIFIGLILILAGAILIFTNIGWISWEVRRILLSWQMLLIVIGLISLVRKQVTQGVILLVIGTIFLLPRIGALHIFPGMEWFTKFNWGNLWPIFLVAVGILIFTKAKKGDQHSNSHRSGNQAWHHRPSHESTRFDNGYVDYSMVFSGSDTVFLEPVFRGGTIESVFGGITLDLRKTDLQEGVSYLKISSVFGGVTLFVPPSWNIEIQSDSVFGNFRDNRPYTTGVDNKSRLIITAECVFGGGEIR
ncbi:MAG TPA: DUF5668 domain-containing protein [Bacteroidales bacterium]|nr:DUF5668 domain-containing protein [Bacteroidales bacterium]